MIGKRFFLIVLLGFMTLGISAQDMSVPQSEPTLEQDSVENSEVSDEETESLISDTSIVSAATELSLPVDSLSDSLVVRIYRSGWDSMRVNPYRFPLDSIKDTFVVDCKGFTPPHINVVTSECGERWGRFHAGTDMRLTVGDTIRSAFKGKVRIAKYGHRKKGYGYYVMVQHENGLETLYAHLSKILVKNNQDVESGEPIGLGGNTGRSTGPHLHFEFRFLGNPINTRNLLEIQPDTMYLKDSIYVVRPKESFKEFYNYLHSPIKYYRVRQGDYLGKIARKYHTTVSRLCRLNRITPNTILRIGRRLRVK